MNEEPLEVVETSSRSIEAIERAEIDIQIATARKFPRSPSTKAISERIAVHAGFSENKIINEETARQCFYAVPRAGSVIQGPSVRLSEIVAACYGNLHIAGRIIDHDLVSRSVTAQAVAWDLQSNVRRTAEWSEPITIKASDAVKMTKLAAISKAERNAIFKVVPRVIWEPIVKLCVAAAVGDVASLQTRLTNAVKKFSAYGIVPEQILTTFEVDSLEKLSQDDLAALLGMYTALKEGTATIDELFKPLPKKTIGAATDRPAGQSEATAVPTAVADPEPVGGVTHPPPADPPRRGRRPGSKNKPKDENPPDNAPEIAVQPRVPSVEGAQAEELQGERLASDGGSSASDPKEAVIAKIRAKLEEKGVSESRLLALLHKWDLTTNPAQPLEDVRIEHLNLIEKRFDQILANA